MKRLVDQNVSNECGANAAGETLEQEERSSDELRFAIQRMPEWRQTVFEDFDQRGFLLLEDSSFAACELRAP